MAWVPGSCPVCLADCTYPSCLPLRSGHDGRGRSLGQQRASRATGALNSEPNPHLRFLKQLGPPGTCQCPWRAAQNRGGTPLLLARDTAAPRPSSSSQASSFPLPAAAVRARGGVGEPLVGAEPGPRGPRLTTAWVRALPSRTWPVYVCMVSLIRAQQHYANVWARVSGNGQLVLPLSDCSWKPAAKM